MLHNTCHHVMRRMRGRGRNCALPHVHYKKNRASCQFHKSTYNSFLACFSPQCTVVFFQRNHHQ
ncbi:ORF1300 [White spot syndrome virus]|uniref:ORF1300 n=1 Tax=White spot syndrome virus TaxID=342409 RepID=A0A2D3I6V5_9VIRU|nr:ORF1300 [White spot syndrome virus]